MMIFAGGPQGLLAQVDNMEEPNVSPQERWDKRGPGYLGCSTVDTFRNPAGHKPSQRPQ